MAIERADDRLLTVPEVAERLRVHPITVRRLIKAGRLPAVRVGRAVRVRVEDVEAFKQPSRLVQLRPPPTPEELERRRKVVDEALAQRNAMPPLGISTNELVRQARRDLEERYDRTRPRRRRVRRS